MEYISNSLVYGKPLGSGYAYRCLSCRAYVGTAASDPELALDILADARMRKGKVMCHDLFDSMWRTKRERAKCYARLSRELGITGAECHFGFFDIDTLKRAHAIMSTWSQEPP